MALWPRRRVESLGEKSYLHRIAIPSDVISMMSKNMRRLMRRLRNLASPVVGLTWNSVGLSFERNSCIVSLLALHTSLGDVMKPLSTCERESVFLVLYMTLRLHDTSRGARLKSELQRCQSTNAGQTPCRVSTNDCRGYVIAIRHRRLGEITTRRPRTSVASQVSRPNVDRNVTVRR